MKKTIIFAAALALVMLFGATALAWSGPEEMLTEKATIIRQRVAEGVITQEQADTILEKLEERVAKCIGQNEDRERLGQTFARGLGFGRANGKGTGRMAQHHRGANN